jgi:predicted transposase YbfD/YdcC
MTPASPTSAGRRPDVAIPRYFARLKDPRRAHGRLHHLQDILVIALGAVLAGAQDGQEIELVGRKRRDWLQRFLRLPHGIPAQDTFERVFDRLQPEAFQACFRAWVQALREALGIRHVALDGKPLRGSGSATLGPLHLVSAGATAQRLSRGQVAVADKSTEITASPELLELLDLHGALVTIDAMGCQKAIARKIKDRGGDYILTAKDNQEHLADDIRAVLTRAFDPNFAGLDHDTYTTRERGHGREEYRWYAVLHDTTGLRQADAWEGRTTVGMCYSERTVQGKTGAEVRYSIGSRKARARVDGRALRGHWGIENSLHWHLDVTFDEDDNRVARRNGAENLALLRRLALSLLHAHPAELSIAKKRFAAALDPVLLEEILRGDGILEKR